MKKLKFIKGIFASKILRKPFYIHFYVTRRCNLKCKMCSVWKHRDLKEMSLAEIKIAAEKIKKLSVPTVVITGGETMLRKDISKIISIFSKLGISTRLQTNGVILTEKKLEELFNSGLDDLSISLDTLNNEKENEICGVKSIDISENAVKLLKLATKKKPKGIHTANIVVSHKNLCELIDLIKFLDSNGIWSSFVPVNLSQSKKAYLFKSNSNELSFTKEDREKAKKIYKEILSLKRKGYKILISSKFLKESTEYIAKPNEKWECDAGELYFAIFPDGQFYACDEIKTGLNILDEDFIEKYKSKKFKNFLKSIQKNCEGCFYGCWRETSNIINDSKVTFDRFFTGLNVKRKELFSA